MFMSFVELPYTEIPISGLESRSLIDAACALRTPNGAASRTSRATHFALHGSSWPAPRSPKRLFRQEFNVVPVARIATGGVSSSAHWLARDLDIPGGSRCLTAARENREIDEDLRTCRRRTVRGLGSSPISTQWWESGFQASRNSRERPIVGNKCHSRTCPYVSTGDLPQNRTKWKSE